MAEYYSGTQDEVARFLLGMDIGHDRIDALDPAEVEEVQRRIDDVLDDELSTVMYTPVSKVVDKNNNTVYPGTVRTIALKRVANEIITQKFGDVQPNVSEMATRYKTEADEEIGRLQRREITLRDQQYKTTNKFIPPEVAPLVPPGATPAGGPG
jgi:hypothetical protein